MEMCTCDHDVGWSGGLKWTNAGYADFNITAMHGYFISDRTEVLCVLTDCEYCDDTQHVTTFAVIVTSHTFSRFHEHKT